MRQWAIRSVDGERRVKRGTAKTAYIVRAAAAVLHAEVRGVAVARVVQPVAAAERDERAQTIGRSVLEAHAHVAPRLEATEGGEQRLPEVAACVGEVAEDDGRVDVDGQLALIGGWGGFGCWR